MLTSLFDEVDDWRGCDDGNSTLQSRARKRTYASRTPSPEAIRSPHPTTGRLPLAGLANQGATCYLNSLLQAFYTLEPMRAVLYLSQLDEQDAVMRVIPWHLRVLFSQLDMSDLSCISTTDFTTNAFDWKGSEGSVQHDAHELVTKLLDLLRNQLLGINIDAKALADATGMHELQTGNETTVDAASVLSSLVQGTIVENSVRCLSCDHTSGRENAFVSLTLPIKGHATLQDALAALFLGVERLEGDNAYSCDNCGKVTGKELSQKLLTVPPILILNLGRFEYNLETWQRYKVTDPFDFAWELEMDQYVVGADKNNKSRGGGSSYALHAVVVHSGSAFGGHYTTYVVDPAHAGQWLHMDDSTVSSATLDEIRKTFRGKRSAYILFYKRSNMTSEMAPRCPLPPRDLCAAVSVDNVALRSVTEIHEWEENRLTVSVLAPFGLLLNGSTYENGNKSGSLRNWKSLDLVDVFVSEQSPIVGLTPHDGAKLDNNASVYDRMVFDWDGRMSLESLAETVLSANAKARGMQLRAVCVAKVPTNHIAKSTRQLHGFLTALEVEEVEDMANTGEENEVEKKNEIRDIKQEAGLGMMFASHAPLQDDAGVLLASSLEEYNEVGVVEREQYIGVDDAATSLPAPVVDVTLMLINNATANRITCTHQPISVHVQVFSAFAATSTTNSNTTNIGAVMPSIQDYYFVVDANLSPRDLCELICSQSDGVCAQNVFLTGVNLTDENVFCALEKLVVGTESQLEPASVLDAAVFLRLIDTVKENDENGLVLQVYAHQTIVHTVEQTQSQIEPTHSESQFEPVHTESQLTSQLDPLRNVSKEQFDLRMGRVRVRVAILHVGLNTYERLQLATDQVRELGDWECVEEEDSSTVVVDAKTVNYALASASSQLECPRSGTFAELHEKAMQRLSGHVDNSETDLILCAARPIVSSIGEGDIQDEFSEAEPAPNNWALTPLKSFSSGLDASLYELREAGVVGGCEEDARNEVVLVLVESKSNSTSAIKVWWEDPVTAIKTSATLIVDPEQSVSLLKQQAIQLLVSDESIAGVESLHPMLFCLSSTDWQEHPVQVLDEFRLASAHVPDSAADVVKLSHIVRQRVTAVCASITGGADLSPSELANLLMTRGGEGSDVDVSADVCLGMYLKQVGCVSRDDEVEWLAYISDLKEVTNLGETFFPNIDTQARLLPVRVKELDKSDLVNGLLLTRGLAELPDETSAQMNLWMPLATEPALRTPNEVAQELKEAKGMLKNAPKNPKREELARRERTMRVLAPRVALFKWMQPIDLVHSMLVAAIAHENENSSCSLAIKRMSNKLVGLVALIMANRNRVKLATCKMPHLLPGRRVWDRPLVTSEIEPVPISLPRFPGRLPLVVELDSLCSIAREEGDVDEQSLLRGARQLTLAMREHHVDELRVWVQRGETDTNDALVWPPVSVSVDAYATMYDLRDQVCRVLSAERPVEKDVEPEGEEKTRDAPVDMLLAKLDMGMRKWDVLPLTADDVVCGNEGVVVTHQKYQNVLLKRAPWRLGDGDMLVSVVSGNEAGFDTAADKQARQEKNKHFRKIVNIKGGNGGSYGGGGRRNKKGARAPEIELNIGSTFD